jgi:hypothetical protein
VELLEMQRDSGVRGVTNITGILFVSWQIIGVAAANAAIISFTTRSASPRCFCSQLLLLPPQQPRSLFCLPLQSTRNKLKKTGKHI